MGAVILERKLAGVSKNVHQGITFMDTGRLSHAEIVTPHNQQTLLSFTSEELQIVFNINNSFLWSRIYLLLFPFTPYPASASPRNHFCLIMPVSQRATNLQPLSRHFFWNLFCPVGKPIGVEESSLNTKVKWILVLYYPPMFWKKAFGRIPLLKYLSGWHHGMGVTIVQPNSSWEGKCDISSAFGNWKWSQTSRKKSHFWHDIHLGA